MTSKHYAVFAVLSFGGVLATQSCSSTSPTSAGSSSDAGTVTTTTTSTTTSTPSTTTTSTTTTPTTTTATTTGTTTTSTTTTPTTTTATTTTTSTTSTTTTSTGCPTNMVALTVKNYLMWCSVSVNGGTASTADVQTICVAPGSVPVSASAASSSFELGPTPWHDTTGDTGSGDPGTVTGATDSTTVTVAGTTAKCAWVCCPFTSGTGCPTTDQCP